VTDAVVIGAGPNGLVAANLLADAGWEVVVVEANPYPGGGVSSAELMERGFVNDLCSAFYPLGRAAPAPLAGLELEEHGLEWCQSPVVLAHPAPDGSCPVLSRNLDETALSLDLLHPGDGTRWLALHDRWRRFGGDLLRAALGPFPPVRAGLGLAMTARGDLPDLARWLLLPVRRLAEEDLGGPASARLLAGAALHADLAPESTLSGFYGWLLCMLGHDVGFPSPRGGAQALTDALVRRLHARGGKLLLGERVVEVSIASRRATAVRTAAGTEVDARRAILADVDAPTLYRDLVGLHHLPAKHADRISRFQWDHAAIKVDWNLDGPIPWEAPGARLAGTVHVVDGIDELTEVSSQIARGLLPDKPFLIVGQMDATDPSRHPAGKETAWAYTHLPRHLVGDAGGVVPVPWTAASADRMADRMERRIEALAPGFRSLIRSRYVADPNGIAAHSTNFSVGAVGGGTYQLHQQLVFRPIAGLARPETPVRGLYLASASAHPGGGVHGAPGANAARAALRHDALRRAGRVLAARR
jgi:phytoene dehydrogenase-like protein